LETFEFLIQSVYEKSANEIIQEHLKDLFA